MGQIYVNFNGPSLSAFQTEGLALSDLSNVSPAVGLAALGAAAANLANVPSSTFAAQQIRATGGNTLISIGDRAAWLIDVRDFGAVLDGRDITGPCQAANAYAASNPYVKVIRFPAGVGKITGTVSWSPGIRIVGQGKYNTVLFKTGDFGDMFQFGQNGNVGGGMEGIGLYHNYTGTGQAMPRHNGDVVYPCTQGALLSVINTTYAQFNDISLYGGKYPLYTRGIAFTKFTNGECSGVWDPLIPSLQSSDYLSFLDGSLAGIPTGVEFKGWSLLGGYSDIRQIYWPGYGAAKTVSVNAAPIVASYTFPNCTVNSTTQVTLKDATTGALLPGLSSVVAGAIITGGASGNTMVSTVNYTTGVVTVTNGTFNTTGVQTITLSVGTNVFTLSRTDQNLFQLLQFMTLNSSANNVPTGTAISQVNYDRGMFTVNLSGAAAASIIAGTNTFSFTGGVQYLISPTVSKVTGSNQVTLSTTDPLLVNLVPGLIVKSGTGFTPVTTTITFVNYSTGIVTLSANSTVTSSSTLTFTGGVQNAACREILKSVCTEGVIWDGGFFGGGAFNGALIQPAGGLVNTGQGAIESVIRFKNFQMDTAQGFGLMIDATYGVGATNVKWEPDESNGQAASFGAVSDAYTVNTQGVNAAIGLELNFFARAYMGPGVDLYRCAVVVMSNTINIRGYNVQGLYSDGDHSNYNTAFRIAPTNISVDICGRHGGGATGQGGPGNNDTWVYKGPTVGNTAPSYITYNAIHGPGTGDTSAFT